MFLVCNLLLIYMFAVFGRIVLSWFPLEPGGAASQIFSVLYTITEPVLGPLRRVVPSVAMLDLSPLIVVIGIQIIRGAIC